MNIKEGIDETLNMMVLQEAVLLNQITEVLTL